MIVVPSFLVDCFFVRGRNDLTQGRLCGVELGTLDSPHCVLKELIRGPERVRLLLGNGELNLLVNITFCEVLVPVLNGLRFHTSGESMISSDSNNDGFVRGVSDVWCIVRSPTTK